jgi:hypothetical protein
MNSSASGATGIGGWVVAVGSGIVVGGKVTPGGKTNVGSTDTRLVGVWDGGSPVAGGDVDAVGEEHAVARPRASHT